MLLENKVGLITRAGNGIGRATASISALGNIGQANYAAFNAGVIGLTKTRALEWARYGIGVNCVAPGLLAGGMASRILDEALDQAISIIPMGRPGDAVEIVPVVLFLASPMSSYVTGQVWCIDGGLTL